MASLSSNGRVPSDGELLLRIRKQDEAALSALYDLCANLVYSFALHALQDPALAEEVTQDTFVKVWCRADGWNPAHGKFTSWLLTVTRYTAIDRWRAEQRQPVPSSVPLETLPDRHHKDLSQADGEQIRRLIDQLPAEQAQVIHCAFFRGMTHTEIADGLKLPLGTVKTRLRLGLTKLRELCLQEKDEEVS